MKTKTLILIVLYLVLHSLALFSFAVESPWGIPSEEEIQTGIPNQTISTRQVNAADKVDAVNKVDVRQLEQINAMPKVPDVAKKRAETPQVIAGKTILSTTQIPWAVDYEGNILQWTGSSWKRMPGKAKDIGAGTDGAVWIIGANPVPGGFGIYKWSGSNWDNHIGGAVRIDVGPNNIPWVVNSNGNIFKRTGNNWKLMPGLAKDIGAGSDGAVWVIGFNPVPGGFGIYKWSGSNWDQQPGGAVRIDVGPNNIPWIVNSNGNILQWSGSNWKQMPGSAKDIGAGTDGAVWIIGANPVPGGFGIYKWSGNNWNLQPGGAVEITVGTNERTPENSDASKGKLPPTEINITDINSYGIYPEKGTLSGNLYIVKQRNGTFSEYIIKRFDKGGVHISRIDIKGQTAGIRAEYIGKLTGTKTAEGTATWTWIKWEKPLKGTWKANW